MPSQNHFDAIALLKADQRKVGDLFDEFEAAKGAARKQALVEKICAELSAHTVIEEEIFYPACRGKVEEGLLNEGYVEHDGSKVLIAELLASAPGEEFYDAKVKVLSEQIELTFTRRSGARTGSSPKPGLLALIWTSLAIA